MLAVWALAVGSRRGRREAGRTSAFGLAAWGALAAAVAGWAVITWSLEPRGRYPTASSLIGEIDGSQAARTALFLGWLALGVVIARR